MELIYSYDHLNPNNTQHPQVVVTTPEDLNYSELYERFGDRTPFCVTYPHGMREVCYFDDRSGLTGLSFSVEGEVGIFGIELTPDMKMFMSVSQSYSE